MTDRRAHALALGDVLLAAIERGRKLHPWRGLSDQLAATAAESAELRDELDKWNIDINRVYAEAIDVFVCAYRAREGR